MNTLPTASELPENCFISHSYHDAQARKRLLVMLPAQVRPIIFPPITVPPEQFVSNELIHAILRCDGLIYLQGGASARSFWVAFERDYALRAGKKIFAFDPETGELRPDASAPLHLPIFPSYARQDSPRVQNIFDFMRTERYFDIWIESERIMPGDNVWDALAKGLVGQIEAGGYVVLFWSKASATSLWVQAEWKEALQYHESILSVLLDKITLPPLLQGLDPDLTLQLYGDQQRSELHRLDDLIVRLYWLVYRRTQQNRLE